jgi:hypothetical protein
MTTITIIHGSAGRQTRGVFLLCRTPDGVPYGGTEESVPCILCVVCGDLAGDRLSPLRRKLNMQSTAG